MEFKDFVDIIYARAEYHATDKDVSITFRDSVLKWYQNIFFVNPFYMEITSKSDYETKLAKVIKQNEN